jgi:16S rRNA (adenine1518-N6/adenine1519-N6)-dimethyltransferase
LAKTLKSQRTLPVTSGHVEEFLLKSVTKARKSLGQNFLVDTRIVAAIVQAAEPLSGRTVVEIGPGHGALTGEISTRAGRVIAIEIDRELVPVLRKDFTRCENLTIVEEDVLQSDLCAHVGQEKATVVANLPYYISTAVLQRLIEQRHCLSSMVLMLQREVVERITAPLGSSDRGYLSVVVQAFCEVELIFDVPPTAFRPQPKVWSSVLRAEFRDQPLFDNSTSTFALSIISAAFAYKRKTIANNLKRAGEPLRKFVERAGGVENALETAGIESRLRAEDIDDIQWKKLVAVLSKPDPG